MKKIHVIVQKKDIVSAVESLREFGSVHVEHQEPLTGYQLEERREEAQILEAAIDIFIKNRTKVRVKQKSAEDWTEVVNATLELSAEVDHYHESIAKRQAQIAQWEPWGDFDQKDIEQLASNGIIMQLCSVPKDKRNNISKGVILETIFSTGNIDHCIAISRKAIDLPFEKITAPSMSLSQMRKNQEEDRTKIEQAQQKIKNNLCYLDSLQKTLLERRNVLNFEEVERGMREEEELVILKGYCPQNVCKDLESKSKQEQWALLIEDPSEEDQVPTYIENPKWVQLVKPVFDIVEIVPGYKEVDISLFFLFFFSLFFGILIGDAAYGAIFFLATLVFHWKMGHKFKEKAAFYLLYVLSFCTIIWGILTGTFFGQQWLPETIQPLLPWLTDIINIQLFCFMIALAHLSIAHIWNAIVKFPNLTFLAEMGWLSIVWGMFFAAKLLVLGIEFPDYAGNFFLVGIPLILFFTKPNKNPLKAIGPGIGDFLLNVVNSFSDVVSYIRLFAVGLATVALADAFNDMALGVGFNNVLVGFGASVILVAGHILNMVLAGLAILVHGLRLNVLEFSGHLNLQWAGFKYNPFRKNTN